jgi:hypothetical protein
MDVKVAGVLAVSSATPSAAPDVGSLVLDIGPDQVDSPVLRRLLEEVGDDVPEDQSPKAAKYNRTHNRHNRQFLLPLAPAEPSGAPAVPSIVVDIDPEQVASPALRCLLAEVRDDSPCDDSPQGVRYDRTHHRHNRQFLLPPGGD